MEGVLGAEGMLIYHHVFNNNNKELVSKFFNDFLIKSLWEKIVDFITLEHCFKGKLQNPKLRNTYIQVNRILTEEYNLRIMPWWQNMYSEM